MLTWVRNDENAFAHVETILSCKYIVEFVNRDFEMLENSKVILKGLPRPSYERYTNLDATLIRMREYIYPM